MPMTLTVDQSLVDKYLARVDRFVQNVNRLGDTLKEIGAEFGKKTAPTMTEPSVQQAAPQASAPQPEVVTADDINIDALLQGIDFGGQGMSR